MEGAKSGVARLERMKRGSGIKDRDDKSSGIEIRMADALAKINPTDPLILAKQAARSLLVCFQQNKKGEGKNCHANYVCVCICY
jgi:hypothetical protein